MLNVFIDLYLFIIIVVYLLHATIVTFCLDLFNEEIWMFNNKHFSRSLLILWPIIFEK